MSTSAQQSAKAVNIAIHRICSKNQHVQIHGLPANLQLVYLAPLDFVKLHQQHNQRQQETA